MRVRIKGTFDAERWIKGEAHDLVCCAESRHESCDEPVPGAHIHLGGGGVIKVDPGDWIVRSTDKGFAFMDEKEFCLRYEVVDIKLINNLLTMLENCTADEREELNKNHSDTKVLETLKIKISDIRKCIENLYAGEDSK